MTKEKLPRCYREVAVMCFAACVVAYSMSSNDRGAQMTQESKLNEADASEVTFLSDDEGWLDAYAEMKKSYDSWLGFFSKSHTLDRLEAFGSGYMAGRFSQMDSRKLTSAIKRLSARSNEDPPSFPSRTD